MLDVSIQECFEKILKAVSYKTVAVQPLTSHLTNHPKKMSKTYCWRNKDELRSDVLLWTSVDQTVKTYINSMPTLDPI